MSRSLGVPIRCRMTGAESFAAPLLRAADRSRHRGDVVPDRSAFVSQIASEGEVPIHYGRNFLEAPPRVVRSLSECPAESRRVHKLKPRCRWMLQRGSNACCNGRARPVRARRK